MRFGAHSSGPCASFNTTFSTQVIGCVVTNKGVHINALHLWLQNTAKWVAPIVIVFTWILILSLYCYFFERVGGNSQCTRIRTIPYVMKSLEKVKIFNFPGSQFLYVAPIHPASHLKSICIAYSSTHKHPEPLCIKRIHGLSFTFASNPCCYTHWQW